MTTRRSTKPAGKQKPRARPRRRWRTSQDAPKHSAEVLREMERGQDRYIERWARKLIVVVDGEVRKLTEKQVQNVVRKTRPKARSRRGQGSSIRSPRVGTGAKRKNRRKH
jgi:hypothetical protein